MFKLLLALLFCVNLNYVAQANTDGQLVQISRQLLQANTTAATGDDDGTDDDGTGDDGTDDDGVDDDGTDDDTTDDDGSDTDTAVDDGSDTDADDTDADADTDTDTDADDGDDTDTDTDDEDDDDTDASTDTDASGSDSDEDGDTNSSDTNASDDDSDGDSDDTDDSDSDDSGDSDSDDTDTDTDTDTDSDTNTFIDPCDGLEGAACSENYDADGNPICAQNVNTADCYSIVQSQGLYGSGNFDEGYKAAQQSTEGETDSLNAVVGVLGAFVAVLALTVGGGAYWAWRRNQKQTQYRHESIAMETMQEAGGANGVALPMIEETA